MRFAHPFEEDAFMGRVLVHYDESLGGFEQDVEFSPGRRMIRKSARRHRFAHGAGSAAASGGSSGGCCETGLRWRRWSSGLPTGSGPDPGAGRRAPVRPGERVDATRVGSGFAVSSVTAGSPAWPGTVVWRGTGQGAANRFGHGVTDPVAVPEANLFCWPGWTLTSTANGLIFQEKEDHGILPLHQRSVIALAQRTIEGRRFHRASVEEYKLKGIHPTAPRQSRRV